MVDELVLEMDGCVLVSSMVLLSESRVMCIQASTNSTASMLQSQVDSS